MAGLTCTQCQQQILWCAKKSCSKLLAPLSSLAHMIGNYMVIRLVIKRYQLWKSGSFIVFCEYQSMPFESLTNQKAEFGNLNWFFTHLTCVVEHSYLLITGSTNIAFLKRKKHNFGILSHLSANGNTAFIHTFLLKLWAKSADNSCFSTCSPMLSPPQMPPSNKVFLLPRQCIITDIIGT